MAEKILGTVFISMLPVFELRGGLPYGIASGLPIWIAIVSAVIGNLIPVPFIIVYIRKVFFVLRGRCKRIDSLLVKFEEKAHLKGRKVKKYGVFGLILLVAVPLPGTGAWTGALVAAFLDMRLKRAFPAIAVGVLIATVIVAVLTHGIIQI